MRVKTKVIIYVIICVTLFTGGTATVEAMTAKEKYLLAEKHYRRLQKNPGHQKYRDKWLLCIEKYQDVYRHDPEGPWAAAGMFKSGELYYELYKRSLKTSDRTEALDSFERIIKRYPKSRYRQKAAAAIQTIQNRSSQTTTAPAPDPTQNQKMQAAGTCYQKLESSPRKQKYREFWLECIEQYRQAYDADPSGPFAAEAMYATGMLYADLYKKSYKASDKTNALKWLDDTTRLHADSPYKTKAESKILAMTGEKPAGTDAIQQVIEQSSSQPPEPTAEASTSPTPGSQSRITGLRHWSNPNYTRIVIDADAESTYQHRLLKRDPSIQKPQRLYVDLDNSLLSDTIDKVVPINDNLLSNVRAGQHTTDTVRVVVDIKSFETYKIFSLRNPFRIVIDVWGKSTASAAQPPPSTPTPGDQKIPPGALAKQLALGVSRIIIDPGHGGHDYGAPGYYKGVHEKTVVLQIAKRLAKKIREKIGCEVIMTRQTDKYLTLEERTAIANTQNADLFISIHTNSARDRRAFGIETFFLNLATDDEAILVAARENATSAKNISDLQTILNDLMQNAKINESSRLAAFVQNSLYSHVKDVYGRIKSKGVKQAPFYVLLGAQMPAILIETSFISNPRECKRLTNAHYQDQLCEGIVKGIQRYIQETNPTALYDLQKNGKTKG